MKAFVNWCTSTLYRFRYFGAFWGLLTYSLYALLQGNLDSVDFAWIATGSYTVLCGAGAATRFTKRRIPEGASNVQGPDPSPDQ